MRGKKEKEGRTKPPKTRRFQRPLIHLREWSLAPLSAVLQFVSQMPACPWVPSPCTAPFLTCMLLPWKCIPGSNCHDVPAAGTLRPSSACYYANKIPGRSNKSPSTSRGAAHGLEQLQGQLLWWDPALSSSHRPHSNPQHWFMRWEQLWPD